MHQQRHEITRRYVSAGYGTPVDTMIVPAWLRGVAAELGEIDGGWYLLVRDDLLAREAFDVMALAWQVAAGKIEPDTPWDVRIDDEGRLTRRVEIRLG